MNPPPLEKSKNQVKNGKPTKKKAMEPTTVITLRIEGELNEILDEISNRLGTSKANLIRNYLEMAKYMLIERYSVKSLNDRDLVIVKKNFLKNLIESCDESQQISLGEKMARFICDIARIQGKLDDIEYKLTLCEHLGFFPKFIDTEGYILFSNKFGPKKFIEAFTWRLLKNEEYNSQFIESEMTRSSKLRGQYEKMIVSIERSSDHYSFAYAKLPKAE